MRPLFSDAWNSFAHFALGFIGGVYFAPVFYGTAEYQVLQGGENMIVDTSEVVLGFFLGRIVRTQ